MHGPTGIFWTNLTPFSPQPWGDLAGFMLFDEALLPGEVQALYEGSCVAGDLCPRGSKACRPGQRALRCQNDAEQTSGLAIGDQVGLGRIIANVLTLIHFI